LCRISGTPPYLRLGRKDTLTILNAATIMTRTEPEEDVQVEIVVKFLTDRLFLQYTAVSFLKIAAEKIANEGNGQYPGFFHADKC